MSNDPDLLLIECPKEHLLHEITYLSRKKNFLCCKVEYSNGKLIHYGVLFLEIPKEDWDKAHKRIHMECLLK
jgi:hypothetical protein